MPAHGKSLATVKHPGPIHALIDLRRKILDFLIRKILPRGEHAAQKNGRIDRRQLALGPAVAGSHVDKMEKEPVLIVEMIGDKPQRVANALENFRRFPVIAMVADAKTLQAKPGGRDLSPARFWRWLRSKRIQSWHAGLHRAIVRRFPRRVRRRARRRMKALA